MKEIIIKLSDEQFEQLRNSIARDMKDTLESETISGYNILLEVSPQINHTELSLTCANNHDIGEVNTNLRELLNKEV